MIGCVNLIQETYRDGLRAIYRRICEGVPVFLGFLIFWGAILALAIAVLVLVLVLVNACPRPLAPEMPRSLT
jgi:hypothetical protein